MPITQERITLLLTTIKHYKDSQDILQATIASYIKSSTDPRVLLVMLSELMASQKLPDNLYENYVNEVAHFRARGGINLAKRRYNEKLRLRSETTALSGPGVDGLKLEHAQRAQARLASLAKPDKRQPPSPPPPDTEKEAIQAWEKFYGITYDWSQWTGPQPEERPQAQPTPPAKSFPLPDGAQTTTGHGQDDTLILSEDVDFPPDEVDGQEDEALAAAQQAFLASQPKYQSKE